MVGAGALAASARAHAAPTPCTKDLQGVGAINGGWFGIRTDGTVWRPLNPANSSDAAQLDVGLGTDNVALADMDGEAIHNCAVKTNGDVYCWGSNDLGQLGIGVVTGQESPKKVVGLPLPATQVAVGAETGCALLNDGSVWCWGANRYGQLGNGTTDTNPHPTPAKVNALGSGNTQVSAGFWHVCAIKAGNVSCWGHNGNGEVGAGFVNGNTSTPISVLTGATLVSAGGFNTCAILNNKSLSCWGLNLWGEMGDGGNTDRSSPAPVPALGTMVVHVDTGVHAVCAVLTSGAVYCWGSPQSGRLGNGLNPPDPPNPADSIRTPAPVSGPLGLAGANAAKVRLSEGSACAIKNDGRVFCWGGGGFVDGSPQSSVPVEVDFCGLPTLDSVAPGAGAYTGGSDVTLKGTEFVSGATVAFGGLPGANVVVVDSTTISVTTPAHQPIPNQPPYPDLVDVTVTNPDGTYARLADAFDFRAPPAVYQATPAKGSTLGGDAVVVEGNNLDATVALAFGGAPATDVVWMDATKVSAKTPAHGAGLVDIVATNADGQSVTLPGGFTYVSPPKITGINPPSGATAGMYNVEISGEGFDFTTTVTFDGVAATASPTGADLIIATVPPHDAGSVDVTVTRADGASFAFTQGFTYSDVPSGATTGTSMGTAGNGGDGGGGEGGSSGGGCYCATTLFGADASAPSVGLWLFAVAGSLAMVRARRRR